MGPPTRLQAGPQCSPRGWCCSFIPSFIPPPTKERVISLEMGAEDHG